MRSTSDLVIVTDSRWIVTHVNPAYCVTRGTPASAAIGQSFCDLFALSNDCMALERVTDIVGQNKVWEGHLNLQGHSGIRTLVGTIAPVFDPNGQIEAHVATLRDLTQMSELELELRQAERFRAIGTFATGLAHDFNNLLTPVLGSVELARVSDSTEQRSGYLDTIERSAMQARELVDRMCQHSLDVPESRTGPDLNAALEQAVRLLDDTSPPSVRFDFRPHDEPLLTEHDFGQYQQLIINLLTNARDAVGSEGVVRIALSRLSDFDPAEDPELGDGPHVELIVSDTGDGIDEAVLERVRSCGAAFDPSPEGRGLSTVNATVSALKGTIQIASYPGAGTSVRVRLPLGHGPTPDPAGEAEVASPSQPTDPTAEAEVASPSQPTDPTATTAQAQPPDSTESGQGKSDQGKSDQGKSDQGKSGSRAAITADSTTESAAAWVDRGDSPGFSIAVIDDDPAVLSIIGALLESLDHRPVPCSSVAEAIELLASDDELDLLITDLGMPDMTGDKLATLAIEMRTDLPVLVLTGQLDIRDVRVPEHCTVLTKPLRRNRLQAVIEELLR